MQFFWSVFLGNGSLLVFSLRVKENARFEGLPLLAIMKVQPIEEEALVRADQAKPVAKSRLKRLFERPFSSGRRISSSERLAGADLEPSSVCLDKMVRNFIEDGGERLSTKCGRSRCNCFHGSSGDTSDDELDFSSASNSALATAAGDAVESIKDLVACASLTERNLLADASTMVEMSKNCKSRVEHKEAMRNVTKGLQSLGYDAAICKSRWEKTSSFPGGEHEYIDVIIGDDRLLVDVDFRSEFEIARSTKHYRAVLQCLPSIFVGKEDRLSQIITVASEAARLSLKKKGLSYPPWRKPEYLQAKWLSPCVRSTPLEPRLHPKAEEREDNASKSETGGAANAAGHTGETEQGTTRAVLLLKPGQAKGERLFYQIDGEKEDDETESGTAQASISAAEAPLQVKPVWAPLQRENFVIRA